MVEEMGERMVKLFESSGLRDIIPLLRWKYEDSSHVTSTYSTTTTNSLTTTFGIAHALIFHRSRDGSRWTLSGLKVLVVHI